MRTEGVYRLGAQASGHPAPTQVRCFRCAGPHKSTECKVDRASSYCKHCKRSGSHNTEVCKGGGKKKNNKQDKGGQSNTKEDKSKDNNAVRFISGPPPCAPPPVTSGVPPLSHDAVFAHSSIDLDPEGLFCVDAALSDVDVPPPDLVNLGIEGILH